MKKACVNNTEFSYSGKECSPLGKGYAADAEQVGTIMEGRDGTMWMVGIKNGVKVWNRVPTDLANDTAVVADLQKPSGEKAAPPKKKTAVKKTTKKQPSVIVSESEDEPEEAEVAPGKPLSDIKEEPEEPPTPAPQPPVKEKKKTTSAKKKVVIAEADVDADAKPKADVEAKVDVKTEVKAEAPKKKVTKKKAAEAKEPAADQEKEPAAKAPKATRAPTDFNLFMKYQLEVLGKENPEMKHKDKFSKAAAQWKELGEDEKKTILVKAKAATAAA